MTPFELEILMHHHISPVPFPRDTDAYQMVISNFRDQGVINVLGRTTELGNAWIYLILNTPIPTEKTVFLDSNGNILGNAEEYYLNKVKK